MNKNLFPCTLLVVCSSFIAAAQNSTAPSPKLVETLKLIQDKLNAQGELVYETRMVDTSNAITTFKGHSRLDSLAIDPSTCAVKAVFDSSTTDYKEVSSDRRVSKAINKAMKNVNTLSSAVNEVHYNLKDIEKVSIQTQQDSAKANAYYQAITYTPNFYVLMLESSTKAVSYHMKYTYNDKATETDTSNTTASFSLADEATAKILSDAFLEAKLLCSSGNVQRAPVVPVAATAQIATPAVVPQVAPTPVAGTTQVAPPPRPAGTQSAPTPNTTPATTSGPTLEATMDFIETKMKGLAPLSYVAFGQNTDDGSTQNLKISSIQYTKVHADPATCMIEDEMSVDGDNGKPALSKEAFSLREAQDVVVQPLEQELTQYWALIGQPNIIYSSANPPVSALVIRQSPTKFKSILFSDPSLADRMAKALVHAIELCGGGPKQEVF